MTSVAVQCDGLVKRYGHQEALRGLDLLVPTGSLFGFLGPNGAGKSTTLRVLSGLVRADQGSAAVFGVDVRRHVSAAKRAAFLIEDAVFPAHLTARQVLKRSAALMRTAPSEEPLQRVGLAHARDRKTGAFSHGMRQRLGLACALLGRPDLLVLDEPQNGLDPEGLRTIRGILAEEHERGVTVLVSVHRLAEVEGLCTHAAIVVQGRIARSGDVETLLGGERPSFRLRISDLERGRAAVREALPEVPLGGDDGELIVEGDEDHAACAAAACVRAGLSVFELSRVRRTLDDFYLHEVHREEQA